MRLAAALTPPFPPQAAVLNAGVGPAHDSCQFTDGA